MRSFWLLLTALVISLSTPAAGETYIRWNQAGHAPGRPVRLVIMSDADLTGETWTLQTEAGDESEGQIGPSTMGRGPHTPLPFNHEVGFLSGFSEIGTHRFTVAGESAAIQVLDQPYRELLTEPLIHLRMMRSGPDTVPPRRPSHPGDARALVWIPEGDPTEGRWKPDPLGRTVDVEGGWYDAGDQLKFTLNISYTVFHLLLAHELQGVRPLFVYDSEIYTKSGLTPLLEEAKHGLDWLMKVHPSDDLFVIQVGNEDDHNQPLRLPEDDLLDGKRPALCALSRVHLNASAAALAMGAITWEKQGFPDQARAYGNEAIRLFQRAQQADTILTAFERGETNDFYLDDSLEDQLALAGVTLHRWTGDPAYLEIAIAAAPPASIEPSWKSWHWSANFALSAFDPSAAARLREEADRYLENAEQHGRPWGIPGRYVWGALHRWIEMTIAAELAEKVRPTGSGRFLYMNQDSYTKSSLTPSMLDYVFGRNNWGVSFLFSERLPNTVRNIYSPAYGFLGIFPTGALSEGPGNARSHREFMTYFEIAEDDPFHRFNTSEGVFFDNSTDFMCQESTITGQADIILLLTLASQ